MRNAVTPRLAAQSPGFSRSPGISSPDVTQPHRFANDITFDYQVALSPRFLQTTSHLPKRDPAWATDHVKLAAELAWASSAEGCPWSARPLAVRCLGPKMNRSVRHELIASPLRDPWTLLLVDGSSVAGF